MRSSLQLTIAAALFAANVACEGKTPTVPEHMKDHFTQSRRVYDAIVRGDLVAMRAPAEWLADHKISDTLPAPWKPHVGDMQNAARLALEASDIPGAADALGGMGVACGGCHTALGATLKFTGMSPEGKESSVLDRMQRHTWAADRMWEGLIGPSDVAWNAGVAAVQDAPLHPEMLADNKSPPQEVVDLAAAVHALGKRGATTREPAARARLYGEFVATCAACHSRLDVQLKPPA